ncbi:hypothetical protein [Clostridium luticellarii]|uniref:hypothetical protein n=1 Tax=Clostridium luticellarii TaxID=1691940 RepID=UPI00235588DE|nr:hypothetical protein [Clostridium luticellarii]MCI1969476.1 hypothetical protein [Clostridium luticellarii]MCI2039643.1 hypothetical protein [Clostridium luticellarii]
MNNNFKKCTVLNLIKLNLTVCKIKKIILFSTTFFLFLSYKIIELLNELSLKYNLDINIWDGFFKVITYPMIVLCVYLPLVIIITSITSGKTEHYQYLIARSKKKVLLIISKLLSSLIIGSLLLVIFFLSAFLMSYTFFGFEGCWSSTIMNINPVNPLYLSSFVFSLTPMQSTIISFLEIYIATAIIISFKDMLTNYISNIYICNLIIIIYIFVSIINYMYNLTLGIFKIINYITLNTVAIISFHKFDNSTPYSITLSQSFIASSIFLITLIAINVIINKRSVIKFD